MLNILIFSSEPKIIYLYRFNNIYYCDGMKGITPIIAIILLLLITISMVGFAFVWFTRIAESASAAGSSQLNLKVGQMAQKIRLDNVNDNLVPIRNIGSQAIQSVSLSFYVNSTMRGCDGTTGGSIDAFILSPGEVRSCYLCEQLSGSCTGTICDSNGRLKITAPAGSDELICS